MQYKNSKMIVDTASHNLAKIVCFVFLQSTAKMVFFFASQKFSYKDMHLYYRSRCRNDLLW
jgi:hypothetical protein